jgi:hypothetical protein
MIEKKINRKDAKSAKERKKRKIKIKNKLGG